MSYTILIEKPAEEFIMRLAKPEKERVLRAIHELPYKGDIKPLQGKKSQGMLRLRVGTYRIIYTVDNGRLTVLIIDAGNRGQIYNRTTDIKPSPWRNDALQGFCHSALWIFRFAARSVFSFP